MTTMDHRQFLNPMAVDGGAVFASDLPGCADHASLQRGRRGFDWPGRYAFMCENFCGDDPEQMNGSLVVQA